MRFTATGSYKIVVKTSGGTTVYTRDDVDGRVPVGSGALAIANGGTGSTTAGAALTALGAASAADLADVAADVAALSGAATSTEKTHIATGTTAQRPASPAEGDIRRNTSTSEYEVYTGSAWVELVTKHESAPTAPTYQVLTSGTGATYTTPAGVKWIRVRAVGGGGGSQKSGTSATSGGDTIFNSVTAAGGAEGVIASSSTPGAGGAGGTGGAGSATWRVPGGQGGKGCAGFANPVPTNVTMEMTGGYGGRSFISGPTMADTAGAANTGAGAGGVSQQSGSGNFAAHGGGGGGEYFELIIGSPSATYSYTIGAAGSAGTNGFAGGSGLIVVEEHYF